MMHLGDNNPTYSYSLGARYLSAIYSLGDFDLLCEAASPSKYDAHLNGTLHKAYGTMILILRGISSHPADIIRTIFVTYLRLIFDYAAILWFPYVLYKVSRI